MPPEFWEKPEHQPAEGEVAIDYMKTGNFSVHWADGAVGGVTPAGYVHFALYAERQSIPRRLVLEVLEDGRLGAEIESKRYSRNSLVRELSCDVMMSPDVAEQLAQLLLEMAGEARALTEQPQ